MYHTQTHTTNTNTVVALAQAETELKLELQVGARLTDKHYNFIFLAMADTTFFVSLNIVSKI